MANAVVLSVTPTTLTVAPGDTIQATAAVRNLGGAVDQFTIAIEGIEPGWYTLPVSSVALFPNDQDNLRIVVHPPEAGIKGGSYPFRIRVTSQQNPAESAVADLYVQVAAIPDVEVDVSPQVLKARKANFHVTVTNPATSEVALDLKPSTSDRRLKLSLSPEALKVPGGSRSEATVQARLGWLTLLIGGKTAEFRVAAMIPGAKEGRVASGRLAPITWYQILYRILTSIRWPWLSRPPKINSFKATTDDNREFRLSWEVKRGTQVRLDDEDVKPREQRVVHPTEVRTYVLTAGNRHGSATRQVQVQPLTVPKARVSERIKASISPGEVQASAGGAPVPIMLQVQNMGEIVDKFLVEVEGIDPAWYNRSASSIALMPQAAGTAQIFFLPPKQKPVRAGKYPLGVTVRSQAAPDEATTVLAQLEILPGTDFKATIRPFRVTKRRKGAFRVALANTGVSEVSLTLDAVDLDEGLKFKFKDETPVLPPWTTVEVPVTVRPKKRMSVGERKRYDITVTARASDGKAQTANCEFNHNPFMTSWRPVLRAIRTIIAIAIIVVAVYFILMWGGGWDTLVSRPQTFVDNLIRTVQNWFFRQ